MRIFKFGGASVKNKESIGNVKNILIQQKFEKGFVVVSAMGKTTNALEEVVKAYQENQNYLAMLNQIEEQHINVVKELIPEINSVFQDIINHVAEVKTFLSLNKSPKYDFIYDQVIALGELLSTKIIAAYLNHSGVNCTWLDAREYIKTNSDYREGKVDYETTCERLQHLPKDKIYIIQGFIGSDDNNFTTTLGREGSDFTGAIISYCLDAESLTIWKDVPGVLNADPRHFAKTQILNKISFEEAIELAYYGATVIHPKTLQPLQHKKIPLLVKSFMHPENEGTKIDDFSEQIKPQIPCYIVKPQQIVLTISSKNFEFIDEKVISDVYKLLTDFKLKVNLIQISAINLYLCLEDKYTNLESAVELLSQKFHVQKEEFCELYTIRNADSKSEKIIPKYESAIIKQSGKQTLQLVIKKEA